MGLVTHMKAPLRANQSMILPRSLPGLAYSFEFHVVILSCCCHRRSRYSTVGPVLRSVLYVTEPLGVEWYTLSPIGVAICAPDANQAALPSSLVP